MNLLPYFISALLLTILCEFFVLLLLIRKDPKKIALSSVVINLVTNPGMNFFYLIYDVPILILELLVILIEMIILKYFLRISWEYALFCAIVINIASYCTGIVIRLV